LLQHCFLKVFVQLTVCIRTFTGFSDLELLWETLFCGIEVWTAAVNQYVDCRPPPPSST
jgi:hypothetical protein